MAVSLPDELIDAVYRTVLEPAAWSDVMALMKRSFPSEAQTFYFLHRDSRRVQPVCLAGVEPQWVRSFNDLYFSSDNPWMRLTDQLHRPDIVRTNERLDRIVQERGALYRSAYYNDWMRPQGFKYTIGNTLLSENGLVANITLLRAADMRTFGNPEVQAFERLSRHMTHALRMSSRLGRPQTCPAVVSVFDAMPQPIALVDARRRVQYANPAMETLLRCKQGLMVQAGAINAVEWPAQQMFAAWLVQAFAVADGATDAGDALQLPLASEACLTVRAIPVTTRMAVWLPRTATVLLLASLASDHLPMPPAAIRRRYGCTRSEAMLAHYLAQGDPPREAARKMGITYGTARNYLKTVFEKLGVHTQAQLVARLLGEQPTAGH